MDEEEPDYGCDRAAFTALLTMGEAADLLDMCIAQVHAENAMHSATQALLSMRKDD
jgi:hypothetical protein